MFSKYCVISNFIYKKKKIHKILLRCLKQPRFKNGAVPQTVLQLQPIVENIFGLDNNLVDLTTSTVSDLNYIPLNKKQKVFINITFLFKTHDM